MNNLDSVESSANPFWPAVSDLMLAVVLILCMVVAAVSVSSFPIQDIETAQQELARTNKFTEAGYRLGSETAEETPRGKVKIVTWVSPQSGDRPVFTFEVLSSQPYLQRITFADSVLFPSDEWALSEEGERVLSTLASVVAPNSHRLEQIQIHGHADTRGTQSAEDNLALASHRATAVFRYLTTGLPDGARLDPIAGPLMSATTFGDKAPVGRSKKATYSVADLCADNGVAVDRSTQNCSLSRESTEAMNRNRRVEVWLYYRAASPSLRRPEGH